MTTQMHRLQISLPNAQAQFLRERARREGISAAEFIRRLLEREEQAAPVITQVDIDEALSFMGIGENHLPLIDGKAVSEYPDLYLAEIYADLHESEELPPKALREKPARDEPAREKPASGKSARRRKRR